jgi:hypothetical protein
MVVLKVGFVTSECNSVTLVLEGRIFDIFDA